MSKVRKLNKFLIGVKQTFSEKMLCLTTVYRCILAPF